MLRGAASGRSRHASCLSRGRGVRVIEALASAGMAQGSGHSNGETRTRPREEGAVTDEQITENPVRSVRKPARTVERDVPSVPPVLVERMRVLMLTHSKTSGLRDALIVTLIAYEGLRPEELLALKVEDVGEKLLIRRRNVNGELLTTRRTAASAACRSRPLSSARTLLSPSWQPASAEGYCSRALTANLGASTTTGTGANGLSADRQDGRAAGAAVV